MEGLWNGRGDAQVQSIVISAQSVLSAHGKRQDGEEGEERVLEALGERCSERSGPSRGEEEGDERKDGAIDRH